MKKKTALKFCILFGVSPEAKFSTVFNTQLKHQMSLFIERQKQYIKKNVYLLKKKNIQKQVQLNTYKGFRFKHGLPVRGQRTHTNAQISRKLNIKF